MGHRIPSGSIVIGNNFAITRDEAVFGEDTDQFIPERWLADDGTLKDLPQTGFGFGRRICTGRHIARNVIAPQHLVLLRNYPLIKCHVQGLFIHMARMLWAFNLEVGTSEETKRKAIVDDFAGSEGFVFVPKLFPAVYSARAPWVRSIIHEKGTTHTVDHAKLLDQAGEERRIKFGKQTVDH